MGTTEWQRGRYNVHRVLEKYRSSVASAGNRRTLSLCLSNLVPGAAGSPHSQALTPSYSNSEKKTRTLDNTSAWYVLPWTKYLFSLSLSQNACALSQSLTQRTLSHHSGLAGSTGLNSSLPLNRDEHRQGEQTNKWLTKTTTTSELSKQWVVSGLPFQVGNGYCLGEREGGLADRIQHTDWSVFHGSAVPYDGLFWRAYANTKRNKICHTIRIRTKYPVNFTTLVVNNFHGG